MSNNFISTMHSDSTIKLTTILPREDDHVRFTDAQGKRKTEREEKINTKKVLV